MAERAAMLACVVPTGAVMHEQIWRQCSRGWVLFSTALFSLWTPILAVLGVFVLPLLEYAWL